MQLIIILSLLDVSCTIPSIDGVVVRLSPSEEEVTSETIAYGQSVIYYCQDMTKEIYGVKSAICDGAGRLFAPTRCGKY